MQDLPVNRVMFHSFLIYCSCDFLSIVKHRMRKGRDHDAMILEYKECKGKKFSERERHQSTMKTY